MSDVESTFEEVDRTEFMNAIAEDLLITREFAANIPLGGAYTDVIGSLMGHVINALAALEGRVLALESTNDGRSHL